MVTGSFKPLLGIMRGLRFHLLVIAIYASVISWLDIQYHLEIYNFPVSIVIATATVIGLLLAFRTNCSYDRWWEARTIWGAIVNDSRTWVRQLLEFHDPGKTNPPAEPGTELRGMAKRQIAWCYALSRSLRGQDPTQDLAGLLDASEIEAYGESQNVPNAILLRQGRELRDLYSSERLELFSYVELERTLKRLTDSMGGCERIKNTVFPTSYSRMVNILIYLFVILIPFGLVNVPAGALIATSISLSFAFLLIDRVALFLQDPFDGHPSDTPMLTLSRTIEINIKQMLGETELPESLKPVDGVLY
ncbi:MAG: bestrophin family protein [Pirellulaceae bacterium]